MFHNGPEYYATVFQGDWNAIMNLLADSPDFRTSDPTPADVSRQEADQDKAPSAKFCLRCAGLLIYSYTASLERDVTGKLLTMWRCVNCGDCVDSDILANRWKNPVPARQRARPPIGPQYAGRSRGMSGMTP
jgi:hypothetical protein